MNDLVRDKFMDKNGNLPLYGEILAGGCVSNFDSNFVYGNNDFLCIRLAALKLYSPTLLKLLKFAYK
jgi:hypothetical protein